MFRALLEKTAESAPAVKALICQVTVLDAPEDRLPTEIVGVVTVKRPLCELRAAVTLDSAL